MTFNPEYEIFLLGFSYNTLRQVQTYLIQSQDKEALSYLNEQLKFIKDEIEITLKGKK